MERHQHTWEYIIAGRKSVQALDGEGFDIHGEFKVAWRWREDVVRVQALRRAQLALRDAFVPRDAIVE